MSLEELLNQPEVYEDIPVEPDVIRKSKKMRTTDLIKRIKIPPDQLERTPPDKKLTPNVDWRLVIDVGIMGCGKTTLALSVGGFLEEYYYGKHGFRTYTILADDLVSAVKRIPSDAEVIYIIVDDAPIKHLAAQRLREDVYTIGAFFRIRHLALHKAPDTMYVLLKFNTQRFKSLDIVFRGFSQIILYKTVLGDVGEQQELKKFLGKRYYEFLLGITEAIYGYHLREFKKYYVYRTLSGARGIGVLDKMFSPNNLIVSETLNQMDNVILEHERIELKQLAVSVIKAAGYMGMTWRWVRDNLLPVIREMGLKIGQQKAFDTYRRAVEYARSMKPDELLEELEATKEEVVE